MGRLLAGAVTLDITPPLGIAMAGYAARDHGAEDIADPLRAKVLSLRLDATEVVIASLDLLYLPRVRAEAIRLAIQEAWGVPPEQVLLNSSHTHYGPQMTGDELVERYADGVQDRLVQAVAAARRRAVPVRLSRGRELVQLGVNRRELRADGSWTIGVNWSGSVIPYVDLLQLSDDAGNPVAVLFAHACHPTTLSHLSYAISADFPGVAQRLIEESTGAVALFLQGCGADINPYPRLDPQAVPRLGKRLGHAVLKGLTELPEPREVTRLAAARTLYELPLEPGPSDLPAAQARLAAAAADLAAVERGDNQTLGRYWAKRAVDGARELVAAFEAGSPITGAPFETQAVVLNQEALVALPAEVLSPVGLAIESQSPLPRSIVLGYSNGGAGYLPHAAVWREQSYEYSARIHRAGLPITAAAAATVVQQSIELLQRFAPEVADA
ncbi:MAG: hypothetical protein IT204_01015 [Fimbriimonadaceae bacterium]|nr:hypothetical protein [Fimbriimonadaceae bacterium]